MRALPICALAAVLAGCGGGPEFSGEPAIPKGYTTYHGHGVSFAYPAGWHVQEVTPTIVDLRPAAKGPTPTAEIQLIIARGKAATFDDYIDQVRVVEKTSDTKVEDEKSVDVPGAKRGLYTRVVTPPRQGSDPVEVRGEIVDVARGPDIVALTAAAPQRDGARLDTTAVIESFRLDGT